MMIIKVKILYCLNLKKKFGKYFSLTSTTQLIV